MNIGETIRRLRRERDITQEVLAEYLGISSKAVSQWSGSNSIKFLNDCGQLPGSTVVLKTLFCEVGYELHNTRNKTN